MLISYYANKKSSPRLPSWQPSLISFNTPIDSGSIIKPCTLKHFQVPILAPGLCLTLDWPIMYIALSVLYCRSPVQHRLASKRSHVQLCQKSICADIAGPGTASQRYCRYEITVFRQYWADSQITSWSLHSVCSPLGTSQWCQMSRMVFGPLDVCSTACSVTQQRKQQRST